MAPPTTPLRVVLVGLSANAVTSWASSAHLPYLLSPRGRARYRIVGLLNSSQDAARKAIDTFGLASPEYGTPPPRAYASPDELAADPDVDLVVVATRVDRHADPVRPYLAAAAARSSRPRAAFVEWPLAQNLEVARELTDLARQNGVRTLIGLQGWVAPPVRTVRELVRSGRLGKLLSVEVWAAGGTVSRDVLPEGLEYFTRLAVGGNLLTVGFAHLFNFVQSAVGKATDVRGRLQLQRPDVPIRDPATNQILRTVRSDVPDLIYAGAHLAESDTVQRGATLSVRFRRGPPFPGEPGLTWLVHGERGEVRVRSSRSPALHAGLAYDGGGTVEIDLHDFATGAVERIPWDWEAWKKELPLSARGIGSLYEAFADGQAGVYPTFDDAVELHEQLAQLLVGWSP